MKRLVYILMLLLLAISVVACSPDTSDGADNGKDGTDQSTDNTTSADTKILYTVYVKDALGEPIANMIVDIMKDGEIVKSHLTDEGGRAAAKEGGALEVGKYEIGLRDPYGKEFHFDKSLAFIDKDHKEVTVTIYEKASSGHMTIYPTDRDDSVEAKMFSDGGYHVSLEKGENYIVFIPTVRGCYRISFDGEGLSSPEYRGAPHFVQSANIAGTEGVDEVYSKDGDLFFNIRVFNIGDTPESTSRYVVMVNAEEACDAILTISVNRELAMSEEELPWSTISPTEIPSAFTLPDGAVLENLDITDKSTTIVYNPDDNRYHIGTPEGKILLVRINTASPFIDSFRAIMDVTHLGTYVYGEDGNLIAKRDYSTMMETFSEYADENTGVYPLTPDILNMIKDIGGAWGWFTEGSPNYLFASLSMPNEELLLYFATAYVKD
jgi:hypothetical protein